MKAAARERLSTDAPQACACCLRVQVECVEQKRDLGSTRHCMCTDPTVLIVNTLCCTTCGRTCRSTELAEEVKAQVSFSSGQHHCRDSTLKATDVCCTQRCRNAISSSRSWSASWLVTRKFDMISKGTKLRRRPWNWPRRALMVSNLSG